MVIGGVVLTWAVVGSFIKRHWKAIAVTILVLIVVASIYTCSQRSNARLNEQQTQEAIVAIQERNSEKLKETLAESDLEIEKAEGNLAVANQNVKNAEGNTKLAEQERIAAEAQTKEILKRKYDDLSFEQLAAEAERRMKEQ